MPGFNIQDFQGGYSADGPYNTVEVRRKHRWVFRTLGRGPNAAAANGAAGGNDWRPNALLQLLSASRPSFKFNVAEKQHNQEISYYAGKQEWEPVTMTWYDAEQNPDISQECYTWLNSVVDLTQGNNLTVAPPAAYKRTSRLEMINGAARTTEAWQMLGAWPETIKWNELDYSANDLMTCEVSLKYDRAVKISGSGNVV